MLGKYSRQYIVSHFSEKYNNPLKSFANYVKIYDEYCVKIDKGVCGMAEKWDLYDINREKTGEIMERGEPIPPGRYRLVVHICIFDHDGRMLIQQRQPFKAGWSNLWDVTVGGSAIAGDTSQTAAEREVMEEIGLPISLEDERPRFTVNFDGGFDDFYCIKRDVDINSLTLQYEEVQAVKWAAKEEILSMIDSGVFIPYKKSFIEMVFLFSEQIGTLP